MIAPSATWDALAEAVLTHDLPMQRAEWCPLRKLPIRSVSQVDRPTTSVLP